VKPAYDSEDDDILREFYNPVLERSKEYCRLAGFFSSTALAVAARGIRGLIENNGKMKLIAGALLQKNDIDAIKRGSEDPSEVIERVGIEDLDSIEHKFVKDHVAALAWLVAEDRLDIRIAIVKDPDNQPIDGVHLLKRGIFHQKVGVFTDKHHKSISFSGSVNETATAWQHNIEEFKVFRNWTDAEVPHFESDRAKFHKYWSGHSKGVDVLEAPQAFQKQLVKLAPSDLSELEFEPKRAPIKTPEPWDHQRTAIEKFENNSYRGILKMATGAGKTYNALFCLQKYFENVRRANNRILIIVPQHNLVDQWIEDIRDFASAEDFIYPYDSSKPEWVRSDARRAWGRETEQNHNIYLVAVVNSVGNFKPFRRFPPDFVIGDEVHSYGTETRAKMLRDHLGPAECTLGLSATPERFYDDEGTERVLEYFGEIIYTYSIKDAQRDSILSNYNYYPYTVDLTLDEEAEIEELTKKIGRQTAADFRNELTENEVQRESMAFKLTMKRARIVKKASNKQGALRKILEEYGSGLKQCIVYCEDNDQLDDVQTVFDELGIDSYVKYHSKIKNREEALRLFKRKNCNYILSMHCLDQGVNIPSCESLILLSSSANPREYIQRRGRVLRNPPDTVKPIVKVFDVLAFPREAHEMFRGLVMTQLVRAWEFISCSQTPEASMKFDSVLDSYEIYDDELKEVIEGW
jgi:superfamily II DNA or RNA helicase